MKIAMVGLVLASFALGCNHVRPPIEGRNDPYDAQQMMFATERLRRDTAIGEPQVSRDDGGLLYVAVPVRSAINKTLYVDYRVTFFDRNRQVLNSTSWHAVTLESNTPQQISANSLSNRAVDFQFDFRYAR